MRLGSRMNLLISKRIERLIGLAKSGDTVSAQAEISSLYTEHCVGRGDSHLSRLLHHIQGICELGLPEVRKPSIHKKCTSIFIVTPTFNSAETLDKTIESIVSQLGSFRVYYHVQDGGSTDETLSVIKKWEAILSSGKHHSIYGDVVFSYSTSPDKGMYDAICKGFYGHSINSNDWMGWINADDQLDAGVFQFLADIDNCKDKKSINWITGVPSVRRENGQRETHMTPFTSELIKRGVCDGVNWWFVQQEGTFWRKKLWDEIDIDKDFRRFRLAGDWSLWYEFSQKRSLFQAQRPFGIFNIRSGQLSQQSLNVYYDEIDSKVSKQDREEAFNNLLGDGVDVLGLTKVDSTKEIIISKRTVLIGGMKRIGSSDAIHSVKRGTPTAKHENQSQSFKIDPYFLKSYPTCSSDISRKPFGIILFGHTRPKHMEAMLRSLKQQNALQFTHVWLDGHQGNQNLIEKTQTVTRIVEQYNVARFVRHNGQLGFRKILIQGLLEMVNTYESFVVLEDDCYPTADAIKVFRQGLDRIADNPKIFSVYGHHFLTSSEREHISRFQGWGWATTSEKMRPILHQLIDCYSMTEEQYSLYISSTLTDKIKRIIDVTPPRNPSIVLEKFFAWDETISLLTALAGQTHMPTSKRVIYNCGLGEGTHFKDKAAFRAPPFNLLTLEEAQRIR